MHAPHSLLISLSLVLLSAFSALAQETTVTNAAGNVLDLTILTNARGVATATETLATLSTGVTQAAVAVVGAPASSCTTAGCPVAPTTYTQNGVIVTWTATTPNTPIPTWSASGKVLGISQYITTIITASGLSGSSSSRLGGFTFLNDYGVMGFMALVGGLVGALVVL
ncbi:hypothetical protein P7C70_g8366, partial [Phenoliferia sp. Uapishka_3]